MTGEDAGALNLKRWLHRREVSPREFLTIAVQLAEALVRLHERNIIHRDINPWNVVIDPQGRATLIEVGTATAVAGGDPQAGVPARLDAELSYVAPEETGRMNRLVDQRADLYSLGAVFYEMLTGRPPFVSEDPVELVHAHLARQPVPPIQGNPTVPGLLSDVILKLLAKTPESRYQSARALLADLQEAKDRMERQGAIAPFELGLVDLAQQLPLPERLYQREDQRESLLAAWESAAAGTSRVVVLSGAAGSGKSALAGELREPVARRNGRLLTAKFDEQRGRAPYAPFAEAFRGLVTDLLSAPPTRAATWRQRIEQALGDNARVMTELAPELDRLIGTPPPVPAVGGLETESRLQLAFQTFIRALAAPEHPLVLFLDDLQWADPPSVRLLEGLATAPGLASLLIVVAVRPEDCPADSIAGKVIAALSRPPSGQRIDVPPLTLDAVVELCRDALRCDRDRALPLAALILKKTAGNPFFMRRMLRFLYQSGLLTFDGAARTWTWDLAAIEKVDVSDNVVDLLLVVLEGLPETVQEVTRIAACIGTTVPLGLLASVCGLSNEEAAGRLRTAVGAGLLVPLDSPDQPGAQASFRFAHDRIRQAAYLSLGEEARRRIHVRVGRQLLRDSEEEHVLDERTYAIVDHLDHGLELITEPAQRQRLSELNLRAARKARASSAYGPALEYMKCAIALLPDQAWASHRRETFALHREAVAIAGFAGDLSLSDDLLGRALDRAESAAERADLYNVRTYASIAQNDKVAAFQWGLKGLREIGVELPLDDPQPATAREIAAIPANLRGRTPAQLLETPPMGAPEHLASMDLLSTLSDAVYYQHPDLWPFVTARMVNLSLEHGNAVSSAVAYAGYAVWLGATTGDYQTAHAFGRLSLDLAARFDDPVHEMKVLALFVTCVNNWTAPLHTSLPLSQVGQRRALQAGDTYFASAFHLTELMIRFHQGTELGQLVAPVRAGIAVYRNARFQPAVEDHLVLLHGIRLLQGLSLQDDDLRAAGTELDQHGYPPGAGEGSVKLPEYQIFRLGIACLLRDFGQALELSNAVDGALNRVPRFVQHVEHNFYTSLVLAARCGRAAPEERERLAAKIATNQDQLGVWAKSNPDSYGHKHLLVAAELARLEGDGPAAAELYDRAISAAGRERFNQDEGLASELCGRFYLAQGRKRIAALYLSAAIDAYTRWGAKAKVEALEAEFVDVLVDRARAAGERGPTRDQTGGVALDLLALFRAAEAVSSEVMLPRLLGKLMEVCLATAGAGRGVFLVDEDGQLFVRAAGAVAEPISLHRTPVEASDDLPGRVVQDVCRKGEALVVGDASAHEELASDPYVAAHRVRSLLALPIFRQAKLMGALYLENNLATRAFTPERVRLLMTLSSHIATSLQNSLLFEQANEAIRLRDEFMSVASHELNTPIASLRLVSQSLENLDATPAAAEFKKMVNIISRQSLRLAALVSDILDVGQIPAGNFSLRREPVELTSLVKEAIELVRADIDRARCRLVLRADQKLVGHWDRARILKVIGNLLSNAIKFGAGKDIEVTVAGDGHGRARLIVEDHGMGISPERLPHIFGRFERAVSAAHYGGLGLGLYIVRAVVEAHGGSVDVSSQPGQGATFTVVLPLAQSTAD